MLPLVMEAAPEFDGVELPTGSVRSLEQSRSMKTMRASAIAELRQKPWLSPTSGAMARVAQA